MWQPASLSPEKARVFAEAARVLRPGGRVVLCDIVASGLAPEVRTRAAERGSCLAEALAVEGIASGLAAAGLAGVEIRHQVRYGSQETAAVAEAELGDAGLADALAGHVGSAAVSAVKPHES